MGNCFGKIKEQEEQITTLKDSQAKKDERIQELEEENLNLKQEVEGLLPQMWLLRENLHQAGWISDPEIPTIGYSYFVWIFKLNHIPNRPFSGPLNYSIWKILMQKWV